MITLVLTNRNRDLRIVKNCLYSLNKQSVQDFNCVLVDYGSDDDYIDSLAKILFDYPKIQFIGCPVSGQLWNKCRAINIALKQCETTYFLVTDIDLIFHKDFIKKAESLANSDEVHYFQYGFLSQNESSKSKDFNDYMIEFKGSDEVTGTSLFPAHILKELNGYDEFYHGWGAEDTDVHIRMKNKGLSVHFHNQDMFLKHQWHPKAYRSKNSSNPFHTQLERINHAYMTQTLKTKRTIVNRSKDWGKMPDPNAYKKLSKPMYQFHLQSSNLQLQAFLAQLGNFENETVQLILTDFTSMEKIKNRIKRWLGKKSIPILEMEIINNLILEELIKNYRNYPYKFSFNRSLKTISLTISCKP